MTLLDKLVVINPAVIGINLQEIRSDQDEVLGWNAVVDTITKSAFSGGTSPDKDTAIRIALAECFERSLFLNIYNNEGPDFYELLLDKHPSSSGFACGFQKSTTRFRSICEGIERWAWSQWIDHRYLMQRESRIESQSKLAEFLISKFEKYSLFSKEIFFEGSRYKFVVFLGESDHGIFAGSRVSTFKDVDIWEHAIIEAYRNFENFKLLNLNKATESFENLDIIAKRARYFGSHSAEAWAQIEAGERELWPVPVADVSRYVETQMPDIYLHRCLMKDYIGWHEGGLNRFVY